MYRETIPTTERLEFDQSFWSKWPSDQPLHSEWSWTYICRSLGHVALNGKGIHTYSGKWGHHYLRGNDRLSVDDIRDLESYFDFLRRHFGILEGATVFPKRGTEPAAPTESKDADSKETEPEDGNAA